MGKTIYAYVCASGGTGPCGMCELFNQTRAKVNKTANKEPAAAAAAAASHLDKCRTLNAMQKAAEPKDRQAAPTG